MLAEGASREGKMRISHQLVAVGEDFVPRDSNMQKTKDVRIILQKVIEQGG
jgi:hypothetical protein